MAPLSNRLAIASLNISDVVIRDTREDELQTTGGGGIGSTRGARVD